MTTVRVNGLIIGYQEQGQGDAIVFLHGVGSDKTLWEKQLDHFSLRWRAVSLDYPGYGESGLPPKALNREEIAHYLLGAMDELGIESAHVVGLSMGGVMALEMARHQRTRLRSLVLADTFAKHPQAETIIERSRHALATMTMREFAEWRVPVVLQPHADEALKQEVIQNMARIHKTSYYWAVDAVWNADYREDLSSLNIPALIVIGQQDTLTPLSLSQELYEGIHGSQIEIIPDAGHISNVDNAVIFNQVVESFVASTH